jgi:hypothetical protein
MIKFGAVRSTFQVKVCVQLAVLLQPSVAT